MRESFREIDAKVEENIKSCTRIENVIYHMVYGINYKLCG